MTSRLKKRGACYASAPEGYAYYGRKGLAHKTAFKSILVGLQGGNTTPQPKKGSRL